MLPIMLFEFVGIILYHMKMGLIMLYEVWAQLHNTNVT